MDLRLAYEGNDLDKFERTLKVTLRTPLHSLSFSCLFALTVTHALLWHCFSS
jgi:hypothetical protein